jgi:hypothetical protein
MEMIQQVQGDTPDELVSLAFSISRLPHPGHMAVAGASTIAAFFLLAGAGGHAVAI